MCFLSKGIFLIVASQSAVYQIAFAFLKHSQDAWYTIFKLPDSVCPIWQKPPHSHRKDGSSFRPKSTMLEKAIRDLEKIVAECKHWKLELISLFWRFHFICSIKHLLCFNNTARPPAAENQDADYSSQSVKRRLPSDVKLKLAKVARLAVQTKTFMTWILFSFLCAPYWQAKLHRLLVDFIFDYEMMPSIFIIAAVKSWKNIQGANKSPNEHSWSFGTA